MGFAGGVGPPLGGGGGFGNLSISFFNGPKRSSNFENDSGAGSNVFPVYPVHSGLSFSSCLLRRNHIIE